MTPESRGGRAVTIAGSHMLSPALALATSLPDDALTRPGHVSRPHFAFVKNEVPDRVVYRWPANRFGVHRVYGPRDVNFDYYPTWRGRDRVVVMPWPDAQRLLHLDARPPPTRP